jgi:hypothetical protein
MIIRSGLIRDRDGVDFRRLCEHWRHVHVTGATRRGPCEPTDKIIFSHVCRPGATGYTASMAFRNSGLTMSVHARSHGVGRTACLHQDIRGFSAT